MASLRGRKLKKTSRRTATRGRRSANIRSVDGVRVRMYRHGLGDCFLLRFPLESTEGTFNVLIDCGIIAVAKDPKPIMQKVAKDIAATCKGQLDLVIVTHEHWDHVSGFSTQQAQDVFSNIDIKEVWYAWTEDPENKLGCKLRKERESKLKALQRAALGLQSSRTPLAQQRADRIVSLLRFFGIDGTHSSDLALAGANSGGIGKTRLAFDYLANRRGTMTRFRHPKDKPTDLPGVKCARVYILGPPEDEGLIKRSSPTKKGREAYEFATDLAVDTSLSAAFERMQHPSHDLRGMDCPFDFSFAKMKGTDGNAKPSDRLHALIDRYNDDLGEAFRRIDEDWTSAAEVLALNLDSHTNNTCLVVAFEIGESGKVLLFAADAQIGNWLSWQGLSWPASDGEDTRIVTAPDLLRRTVFYKVGHHGSHNATLRTLGLEQMTSEDLVAFIPVFKEQAEKSGWHEMPFSPLVKRLKEKTAGRLVFSDEKESAPSNADLKDLTESERNAFRRNLIVAEDKLYYEYAFPE